MTAKPLLEAKRAASVLLLLLAFTVAASAQQKVSGIVKDETGEPFSFVDVLIKGTTTGTVTDIDGKYTVTLPAGKDVLQFSFLGYQTVEVKVGQRSVINVELAPASEMMDEVVIIAFGEQRKYAMSSSVSTIKEDEIVKASVANISNALAGRVAGLVTMQDSGTPGADGATLIVRGVGSWNSSSPLYVIDGIERNSDWFQRLDPSEVESFSVLKDAAATAVYGSKGANGVILVTTKRGVEGAPKITFSNSTSLTQPTRYPHYLNSYESLKLYNEALVNDGGEPLYSDAELEHYKNHDDLYRYPDTDWYDLMMKKVVMKNNTSLNIRGGSKSVRYFVSGSYLYQDGMLKTEKNRVYNPKFSYQRYTFRSNVDILLTDAFTISIDFGGAVTDRNEPVNEEDVFTYMNRIPSWAMPAYNPDGSYAGTSEFPSSNPVYYLNTRGNIQQKHNTLTTAIKLTYDFNKFIKGLKLSVTGSYDSNFGNYNKWTETQSTYQLVSEAGHEDRYISFNEPSFFTSSEGTNSATRKVYGEANIKWQRQFHSHDISLTGVANVSDKKVETSVAYRSANFILRGNYAYKKKYFLEANASYRGSENFAPGKRFGLFPSVSLGWNVDQEKFLKKVSWIDNLKVRASFGITGEDYANDRFIYQSSSWTTSSSGGAKFGTFSGNAYGSTTEPSIANPDATWEKAYQTNVGVDFVLFKKSLSFSVERFFEKRTGLLMSPNSIPGILGIGVKDMNIGKTSKQGWEFDFKYKYKVSKDFSLALKGNFSYFDNKVIYKDEAENTPYWQKAEGNRIGQNFGYVVIGYFKDQEDIDNSPVQQVGSTPIPGDFKYLDYNGDGVINTYDQVAIGYPKVPRISYGFTFSADYKGFSLDVHFQGTGMSSVFISNYLMYEFYNRGKVQEFHLGRWTPETADTATYPALHVGGTSQNNVRNSYFQKDNSYLRLKNVELSYNFNFKKDSAVKSLRLYASGNNIFTWDKLKVVDPETPTGSTGAIYPQTKSYTFGINLTF